MKIRKKFTVESAHIVRNCTSHRCSHSIHGHSATIELVLEGVKLDNAGMLYDFGLMKGTIKEFIDSTDHCYLLCKYDKPEFCEFIKKNCDRWIELPFNPSAEYLSMFYMVFSNIILEHTKMNNGEGTVRVSNVRYHETATGWAECDEDDIKRLWSAMLTLGVVFSDGVTKDWSDDLKDIIFKNKTVKNPTIKQQINIL